MSLLLKRCDRVLRKRAVRHAGAFAGPVRLRARGWRGAHVSGLRGPARPRAPLLQRLPEPRRPREQSPLTSHPRRQDQRHLAREVGTDAFDGKRIHRPAGLQLAHRGELRRAGRLRRPG